MASFDYEAMEGVRLAQVREEGRKTYSVTISSSTLTVSGSGSRSSPKATRYASTSGILATTSQVWIYSSE